MEIKEQVISPEQARKLWELWFSRDGYFEHIFNYHSVKYQYTRMSPKEWDIDTEDMKLEIPAYTVSEIMEYLPHNIWKDMLRIEKVNTDDWVFYFINYWHNIEIVSENLAQALWDMLIYLIENKYIDVKSEK